ncbi:hypothetical protein VTI74DRAFT_1431 [Chaetomium olivicolor]
MYKTVVLILLATGCVTASPPPQSCRRFLVPRQANGIVDASNFLRRAYHSSAVLNRRVYVDGGEFSYREGDGIAYEYSNTLISIDLTQDWTIGFVPLSSIPKPLAVPSPRYGGLWVDRKGGVLYAGFAGTKSFFADQQLPQQALWSFTPVDSGEGVWKRLNQSADAWFSTQPRSFGGQVASGDGYGFLLGGFVENDSGTNVTLGRLVTYNFANKTLTNSNLWGPSGGGWMTCGGTTFVPNWGKRGILVHIGGSEDNGDKALVSFETVYVYDADAQRWHEQKTTGNIPQPRKDFCIAGAPSSNRTHDILVYAGWNGELGSAAVPFDSAYVLTLPGFYWVKADYPAEHPRQGLSCNAIGGGQILTIGGLDTTQQDRNDSYRTGFKTPDPFIQGLAIFDLSRLAWSSGYSARRGLQPPAPKIQEYYNAKGRRPEQGFSTPSLASLFAKDDFSSDTDEPSTSSPASSKHGDPPTGMVVGMVCGAVGTGVLALLAVYYCRKWKRKRRHQQEVRERREAAERGEGEVGEELVILGTKANGDGELVRKGVRGKAISVLLGNAGRTERMKEEKGKGKVKEGRAREVPPVEQRAEPALGGELPNKSRRVGFILRGTVDEGEHEGRCCV